MRTERKKTVNWRRLAGLVGANRRHFLSATVFVLLAVCASYAIPFVTSFTLDYVIRGDASGLQLPAFLLQWLDRLGGRDYFLSLHQSAEALDALSDTFTPRQQALFRAYEDARSESQSAYQDAYARQAFLLARAVYR